MGGRSRQGYNEMNTALVGGFFTLLTSKKFNCILYRRGSLKHHKGSSYLYKHLLYYKITAWSYILVLVIT